MHSFSNLQNKIQELFMFGQYYPQSNHKEEPCEEGLIEEEAEHSLASKAMGYETNSTSSRSWFHLVVIPAEAGIHTHGKPGFPFIRE